MAGYNSVPLGRSGTGAAFVLGESQAANQLLSQIDENRAIAQQNALRRQQYAQQLANDWKQNQLKIKGGTLWESDLQSEAAKVMELGTKLRQAGFNPYQPNPNDPIQMQASELFLNKKRQVEDMADYREKIQTSLGAQHKLNDEKFGYFDPETVAAVNSFPTQYSLKDAYTQGVQAPTLRKAFNLQDDVLKNIKGVGTEQEFVKGNLRTRTKTADIRKHDIIADQTLATNNYLISDFKRRTGFEPQAVAQLGDTKESIQKELDQEFRGNPQKVQQLAQMGIQSFDSPQYQQLLASQSDQLFTAKKEYNNVKKSITDKLDNDVDEYNKTTPDYTAAREARANEMLRLARKREARLSTEDKKAVDPTYIQDLYNRVLDGEEGSGEEFYDEIRGGILNKGGQTFVGKPELVKNTDGSWTYKIPKVVSAENEDGDQRVIQAERNFTFDPRNRAEATRVLNNMRNTYVTNDRQPYSKVFTQGGKGKVPGGQGERGLKSNNSNSPKKGTIMKVKEGTAVYNGERWVLKK